ncbi:IclR family transcriptional regulator [Jannaschia rubra]|uniref:Beta-ketoadipate pathway transcriptional regulators, PcaR/PcaU/PobR family n=1 Tax=Jannaschia rubra TaxID=282197 RepID=A0A0M6XKZ8_9RHOB|nr:helix-turn-helix domain-containing protein [Jannaschia rubra]CTQ31257.1 beta-ketoadipate pathway transcriptional regulators, PcaR/PcaU/PobR family [Jannaschia rubra]SFF90012.1 transcriptional regulator, IclR family [Jannaschia rubra]
MSSDPPVKFVPAVQNAVRILHLLTARGRPMGATQIAREAGLNVSSAFNILRTLTHEGLIGFDPAAKTYTPDLGLLDFAAPLLGADPTRLIRPMLGAIAQDHRTMVALWQITATDRIVLIDRFTPERIVQAVIARNARLPVFGGAVGRCYVAATGMDRDAARAGYDGVRWQSAPGFDAYWDDACTARRTGVAFDRGRLFRGLEIVASLASDAAGRPRLGLSSITIAGQHAPCDLDRIGDALRDAALQIETRVLRRAAPDAPTPPTETS